MHLQHFGPGVSKQPLRTLVTSSREGRVLQPLLARGAGGQQVQVRTFCSISDQTVLIKAFPCLMDFNGEAFTVLVNSQHKRDMRGDRRETEGCRTQDHQRMGRRQERATHGDHNRGQQPTQNQRNLRSCDKERGYIFNAESSSSRL